MAELADFLTARNPVSTGDDPYAAWARNRTPENLKAVLDDLDPTITSETQRFSGPKPLLKSRARVLAVKAVKSYDPSSGAKLRSWVVTQLQPLARYNNSLKPIHVPEEAARQAYKVHQAFERFVDETGRDPTDDELADAVGISVRRLQKIRTMTPATVNEPTPTGEDDGTTPDYAIYRSNPAQAAASAVYDGLDRRDRLIFDLRTGSHGKAETPGKTIADLLRISPAAVTQRSNAIATRIRDLAGRMQ